MEATEGMSLLSVGASCCVSVWSGSGLELNLAALSCSAVVGSPYCSTFLYGVWDTLG